MGRKEHKMIAECVQLRTVAHPNTAALDCNHWTIECGEREGMTHIDGYMIVYDQRCKITLRTSLTADQKRLAVNDLLRRLPQMAQPARQIFLWSVNDATPLTWDA